MATLAPPPPQTFPDVRDSMLTRSSVFNLFSKRDLAPKDLDSEELGGINQYKDVTNTNELRTIVIALEKESLKKNKETRQAVKDLREIKSKAKAETRGYEATIKALKAETDVALIEAKNTRAKTNDLSRENENLGHKLTQLQMQNETNLDEMEDLEDELKTWKEYSQTAVKATQTDVGATITNSQKEKEAAIQTVQLIKEKLSKANDTIVTLKEDIKGKEESTVKTQEEIAETKKYIATKTAEFERALLMCKQEANLALETCKKDAGNAQKYLVTCEAEKDAAIEKAKKLKAKVAALNQTIAALEDEQALQDKEHETNLSKIHSMREELTKSKESFENALKACEIDINDAFSKIQICVAEKESALADAEEANMNLSQVNRALIALQKDMEEEKRMYNMPWWKKLFCSK